MVGCLEKEEENGVIPNDDRYAGCWMCAMVCPFGGIKRDEER